MKKRRVLIMVALLVTAALSAAYLSLLDYPRIVRSAYYRNPYYVLKVVTCGCWARRQFPRAKALDRVRGIGLVPEGNPRFLYLLDEPREEIDKPIVDRYFGLLAKTVVRTRGPAF